jgi:ACS family hexuronate transporter-like MFS transporter
VSRTEAGEQIRWLVLSVFLLSSAINYLDRQTLATLGPVIRGEFRLSTEQFGWVIGVFSAAYALSAPFAGMLIDRAGLTFIASLAVGSWSLAGIATAFTQGFGGLLACRTALGVAESAGIPAAGKAIDAYLRPGERALGNAMNQAGVSVGLIAAPPLATWIAGAFGWRYAFAATGVLGLLWIPVWNLVARRAPASASKESARAATALWSDLRLWAFVLANALTMSGYSLWTNWTTFYFVDAQRLPLATANRYVLAAFTFAAAGGFTGGWLSARLVNRSVTPPRARFRVCVAGAVLALIAVAIPAAPSPGWAAAGISLAFFAVSAMAVNIYSLPLDTFGGERAASAIAALVASYGAMQIFISPLIGSLIDAHCWAPLMWGAAATPALACAVLWSVRPKA